MRRGNWIVIGVALGMIIVTAWGLVQLRGRIKLGHPGVRVEPEALYGADGVLVTNRTILLPAEAGRIQVYAHSHRPR